MIDWRSFSVDLQDRYARAIDVKNDLGWKSQQQVMNAWHGRSIGLVPFLQACQAMGAHPLRYLYKDAQS